MKAPILITVAAVLFAVFTSPATADYQLLAYYYDSNCGGQPYTASFISLPGSCVALNCISANVNGRSLSFRVTCPSQFLEYLSPGMYVTVINQVQNPANCTGITEANFYASGQCITGYAGLGSVQYECADHYPIYTQCNDNYCQDCQTPIKLTYQGCGMTASYICINPANTIVPSSFLLALAFALVVIVLYL